MFCDLFQNYIYTNIEPWNHKKVCFEKHNYNLKPNEVLFIDDSPQHIEGAKRLGIQSHHLQDNEEITTLFPDIIL